MSRTNRIPTTKKNRIKRLTKGYYGRARKSYRLGKQLLDSSYTYTRISRKLYKRYNATQWNRVISQTTWFYSLHYQTINFFLRTNGINLDRKCFAYLLIFESRLSRSLLNWCVTVDTHG
nr:50S ribosomal protein L20 [Cavernulicola chilensis]